MSNYRTSFWNSMPVVTKNLLIINVLMWFASIVLRGRGIDLTEYLGLHFWLASDFNPAQLLTYMFMHDTSGIAHLFFNMFSLFMFGVTLERVLGAKRYLFFYISCGLGAAIVQEKVNQMLASGELAPYLDQFYGLFVTVGASGAVFGILLAFGMIFPNMPMYIIPIPFPIKAKYMVLGYGALELLFGISGAMSSVAHFAHLGGMLFGFIIIWYWKKNGIIRRNGIY